MASTTVHRLLTTTIDDTAGGNALVSGFNTVDTTTVTCPKSAGCTIGFGLMVQVGGNTAAGNKWAICALVDGHDTNPGFGCPYQNELATNSSYQVGNSRQNLAVAFGAHTVTTEVFMTSPALLGESEFNYLVYAP